MSRDNARQQPGDPDRVVVPLRAEARESRSRHPSGHDVAPGQGAAPDSGQADVLDFTGGLAAEPPDSTTVWAPSEPENAAPSESRDAAASERRDAAASEPKAPARSPLPGEAQQRPAGPVSVLPTETSSEEVTGWQRKLADALALLRRRLEGDYAVDDFGFDPELAETVLLPALELLYDRWFRVEVNGAENLPVTGGALIVANHAGGLWPVDGAMLAVAVHREHPTHRFLRPLAADLLFGLPTAGMLARRGGTVPARRDDAGRLLRAGELVGVWPEGFAGIGKPFRERYQLQRFGRGGFVRSAIRARVPIVPASVVGAEEIHPVLGRSPTLARLLGLPYFPFTPTFPWLGPLGLVPLPSKWYIEFGDPLPTDALAADLADDPETVFDLTDRVRDTIQATLQRLLLQRRSVWR